jgi:hypothetical protein
MAQKGRVFTGCRARISINGKKVGYCTGVDGHEEVMYEDVEVLDNIEVEEIVPIGYRVTLSARQLRIVGETAKTEGLFPKVGTSPEEHLKNVLLQKDMEIAIEDTKTPPTLLATYEGVKMGTNGFSIQARGIVGTNIDFRGIRVRDESGG